MTKILITGLGNPGFRYQTTRHNIGFIFLILFSLYFEFPDFKYEKEFLGFSTSRKFDEIEVHLLKPDTYMNLSGDSLSRFLKKTFCFF